MDTVTPLKVQGPLIVLVGKQEYVIPLQRKNHPIGKATCTEMKVAFIISLHHNSGLVKLYWGLVQLTTYKQQGA